MDHGVCRVVIGCATPTPPDNGWVDRGTSDTVIVGCNFTNRRWYLHCDGRRWVGDWKNCTVVHDVGLYATYSLSRFIPKWHNLKINLNDLKINDALFNLKKTLFRRSLVLESRFQFEQKFYFQSQLNLYRVSKK